MHGAYIIGEKFEKGHVKRQYSEDKKRSKKISSVS